MRRIALMWTVRSWMKEYSLVFSPTEATKLKDFLSVAHPDGVARTFIGMVPWGLPWIVTLKNLPKGKRVPQLVYEYKKAKLCIEWNPVVRAWLHVLVDQPSGENDNPRSTDEVPRDQELSYFYFPGKLRTIPSSRLQPQPLWNCASISFLINCRALVPSTSLVINPSALLTGMQKAVQQRNLLALDVLCQLQRPSWPAFHYAMSADDVDAFKVLLMYGGQFPSPDEAVRLHAWAHYLQLSNGNGASVRRTRDEAYREDVARLVFGQWLCDFLDELPERRKTSRPLFVDGCVHDLEAWRKDRARLEKVFSNVRIDIEDEAGIQEEEERGETRSESENIPVGEN
ncbi:hypothetical protein KEM55_004650 [Ascosphaera atra]|nr:hypothetical protein KEM55_004650 [Ascosphaera atra]